MMGTRELRHKSPWVPHYLSQWDAVHHGVRVNRGTAMHRGWSGFLEDRSLRWDLKDQWGSLVKAPRGQECGVPCGRGRTEKGRKCRVEMEVMRRQTRGRACGPESLSCPDWAEGQRAAGE